MTKLIAAFTSICLTHAAITQASELAALRIIESNDNPRAVGKAGERTAYQILPRTWKQYAEPGMRYTQTNAHVVAMRILHHNRTRFVIVARRQPVKAEVYAMWNLGYVGFKRRHFDLAACPRITQDAAMRFAALAEDIYERN